MKILFFLLSTSIFANPYYKLEGTYSFTGDMETTMAKRNEPVYAFTQWGRERLQVLKEQGYSCVVKPRQTYLCSLFDLSFTPAAHILERANAEFEAHEVRFEKGNVKPEILSEGDFLVTYRFSKKVTHQGKSYPYYDYQMNKESGGLHKVKFGQGVNRVEYIVRDSQNLEKAHLYADQEPHYYEQYLILGSYENL